MVDFFRFVLAIKHVYERGVGNVLAKWQAERNVPTIATSDRPLIITSNRYITKQHRRRTRALVLTTYVVRCGIDIFLLIFLLMFF